MTVGNAMRMEPGPVINRLARSRGRRRIPRQRGQGLGQFALFRTALPPAALHDARSFGFAPDHVSHYLLRVARGSPRWSRTGGIQAAASPRRDRQPRGCSGPARASVSRRHGTGLAQHQQRGKERRQLDPHLQRDGLPGRERVHRRRQLQPVDLLGGRWSTTVYGTALDFVGPVQPSWNACSRSNGSNPVNICVAINYRYTWTTPLLSIFKLIGSGGSFLTNLTFLDKTVMNLESAAPTRRRPPWNLGSP